MLVHQQKNKHFKDDICKNLIDAPNYPIFSRNIDYLYQLLNQIASMAIECILRGESDPQVKKVDDELDSLTWNEKYDYDEFIEDNLYEYDEYTEEEREEKFKKSEKQDILHNIFNGKIPIIVRKLRRLRREVLLDPIKNKMYDDYVLERIPEYDNSKWQTKYKILEKFMLYPEEIFTYFDALRLEKNSNTM